MTQTAPTAATARFFDALQRRGHEPLLEKARGTVRIDLRDRRDGGPCTQHWLLHIDLGDVRVTREEHEADGVVSACSELFDQVVTGEENAVAAMLRGAIMVSGDLRLILLVERLFPGPPGARGPRHLGRGPLRRRQAREVQRR